MTIRIRRAFAARIIVGAALSLAHAALAEPLTNPSQLSAGNGLITFTGRPLGHLGPVAMIQCTQFAASQGLGIVDLSGQPYVGPLVGGNGLHPLPGPIGSGAYLNLSIVFNPPVSEVGMGIWDPNLPGFRIRVFDINNQLLEEVPVPLTTGGGTGASFAGIRRPTREIALAVVFPGGSTDTYVIDNISYGPICYGNCDCSATPPVLTANDFQCFLDAFAAGDGYANCDGSTSNPILTANDFQCFLNAFAAGCS